MDIEKFTNLDNLAGLAVSELLILAGLGLAVLLFGYRIKKIAFFIIWFILGYNLMTLFIPTINNFVPQIAESELYQLLLPVAGGLLLALLGFTIEKLCVGGICFALVLVITARYFGTEMQTLAIGAVVGVIAAGVAVMMMKPAIIIATSVAGSYAITLAVLALVTNLSLQTFYWPILLGVAAVGALFQFATTKRLD